MAPVVLALQDEARLEHRLIVTAQHRGLLDEVLELFKLKPDYDLDLMQERQSLDYVAAGALGGLSEILRREEPQFVLVHGDTTTTMIAALASFYLHIPVGHVEAGLRTSTIHEPFPEELNRRVTDLIAAHYYCPTDRAAANLRNDIEHQGEVFVTGNTALDAVRLMHREDFQFSDRRLAEFAVHSGPKLIVTAHRRENWGARMQGICSGLAALLEELPDAMLCFCWHPNPAVREVVAPLLGNHPRALLVDPPRFDVFVNLVGRSDLVLTDSGGIQEEVTMLRRYALVLRNETERPEAVEAGFARIVGTDSETIRTAALEALARLAEGTLLPTAGSPFGDGHAAERIRDAVIGRLLQA